MCEANAYLIKDGKEELIMEAVETVEPDGDNIKLSGIFGNQKFLKAKIHSLMLTDNKIFLKSAE